MSGIKFTVSKNNGAQGADLSGKMSGYNVSFEDKKIMSETADGTTHMRYLTTKATITVTWSGLTDEELQSILSKINVSGVNTVQYYDCNKPFDTDKRINASGKFFVGGRNAVIEYMDNEGILWKEFTLVFVEQ